MEDQPIDIWDHQGNDISSAGCKPLPRFNQKENNIEDGLIFEP